MNNEGIIIIDYGGGNLRSVFNAITKFGYHPTVTNNAKDILASTAVILPGVGDAGDTMDSLERLGLSKIICQLINEKRPFLAICVGLQVLLSATEERGWHKCLGVIPGIVKKLPPGLKIPHMGWNQVKQIVTHPFFEGIPNEANFYFVHSYYAKPDDASVVAGTTEYGISLCSVVIKDNLIATQFHPEKSGTLGLKLYSNFLKKALSEK